MTQENKQKNDEIDVRRVLAIALNHWYWFVIGVVVALGLGTWYILTTTPKYTTEGAIMLRKSVDLPDDFEGTLGMGLLGLTSNSDASEAMVILSSRDLMYQALDALNLWDEYRVKDGLRWKCEYPAHTFTVEPVELTKEAQQKGGYEVTIAIKKDGYKVKVKQRFRSSSVFVKDLSEPVLTCVGTLRITQNYSPKEEKWTKFRYIYEPKFVLVDVYRSKVTASLSKNKKVSNVVELSMTSDVPQRDRDLLTKMIELYNMSVVVDKNTIATNTEAFIKERLAVIENELSEAENAVAEYKKQHNIADLEEEAKIFLRANSDEQKELADVETQLNLVNYIETFLNDDTKRFSLIPANIGITDQSLTSYIGEYNKMLLQRMRILRTATDDNPVVEQLNGQLLSMRENIIASIASVRESLSITKQGLDRRDSQFNARIKSVPTQERQYLQVKRQQELKEAVYLFLYQKREENALMLASTATPAKVVDAPKVDTATGSPRPKSVLFLCILLGLLVPAGLLFLWTLFYSKISDVKEFEAMVEAPCVGHIVENSRGKHIAISEGESSVSAEQFRLLRTNLRFMLPAEVKNPVVMVTSCISGEGKSYVATNTALSLAILGKKVVLVGLDIRKPMLATYFNLPNKGCLTSYLSDDDFTVDDTIQPSGEHSNLDIIPCGAIPPNPSELLQNGRLDVLFAELRKRYDYIIVDTAPVALVSDTFLLSRIADMTLFVSRAHRTPREMVEFINQTVEQKHLTNVACVLNGVKQSGSGYGYGYGYGYGTTKS